MSTMGRHVGQISCMLILARKFPYAI